MERSFFQSLHFKLASGVIGVVVVLSTLYFIADYRLDRARLFNDAKESAHSIAQIALNSLIQMAMLGEHPELLQEAVESLTHESEVREIQILDLSGRVRYSSDAESLDIQLDLQDPGCKGCHVKESDPARAEFLQIGSDQVLRHVQLIPNRAQCRSCHSADPDPLGILIVDFPTTEIQIKLQSSLKGLLFKAGVSVVSILLVLGALMNHTVISRIKRLTQVVSGIGSQNAQAQLKQLKGQDEIGQLATSFETMARDLQQRCQELEENEHIRVSLLKRLVHSQEEERRVISRELHDQIGQSLSALLLTVSTNSEATREGESPSPSRDQDLEARIRRLIDKVHRLAWEMRPSILDDYGLDLALKRYIDEVSRSVSVELDYQQIPSSEFGRLPIWIETALYRIAQEGITNVIKHAEASRASIILMRRESEVTLLVEDNGKGCGPTLAKPASTHGLGLLGMQERVAQCGGSFHFESAPLKGTTLRVQIPLK